MPLTSDVNDDEEEIMLMTMLLLSTAFHAGVTTKASRRQVHGQPIPVWGRVLISFAHSPRTE